MGADTAFYGFMPRHLGRLDEAQKFVNRLRAITPAVIPTAEHWRIREDREYFLDGLRLGAGETA